MGITKVEATAAVKYCKRGDLAAFLEDLDDAVIAAWKLSGTDDPEYIVGYIGEKKQGDTAALAETLAEKVKEKLEPRDPKRQLWALVETLQSGSTARQPLPEHRKTGEMAQLILQVFPQNKWARGKVTNLTERSTPLGGVLVDYLGDSFKFVGRQLEVHSARDGMVLILQHQKMTTFPKPDRAKSGTYRQAVVGAAGAGKTAFAERVCQDVAALPAVSEDEKLLQQMLRRGIDQGLQYRMDFSELGNRRQPEERDGSIAPAQSLALRILCLMCEGPDFRTFLDQLTRKAAIDMEPVAALLAGVEMRDVITAACLALGVSGPSVFDILFDECQTEFEVHRHRHVHADSNVLWFKRMMSSHAFNTPYVKHIVLLKLAGTIMDIASVSSLSESGTSQTFHIPLKLLTHAEVMEILQDLCIRLGQEWQPQLLDMLAKFSGGNVRHLECLLAAAASLCLHTTALTKEHVQLAGLRKVFSPDFQFTSASWERALGYVYQRTTTLQSVLRWREYQDGRLMKTILGACLSGKVVRREEELGEGLYNTVLLHTDGRDPATEACVTSAAGGAGSSSAAATAAVGRAPLFTYGSCEATGVLALDPCQPVAEIANQEYTVKQPPMVFLDWFKRAKINQWVMGPKNALLSEAMHALEPMMKEVVDVTSIMWKMAAMTYLLGLRVCSLGDLLPCDTDELKELKGLQIQLPERAYHDLKPLEHRATTKLFSEDFIPDALADKKNCRAYIGFGKDPAPDWFIILHTVDGDVVVVQGQSKCHQADGHVANMALFEREYGKRLKDFKAPQGVRAIKSVFVLATDATVKNEAGKRLPEDAVIIDRNKRTKLYNPFGAVLREYYQS